MPLTGELPGYGLLYDFYYNHDELRWAAWSSLVPPYQHDPELSFYRILVPTVDTCRATWLVSTSFLFGDNDSQGHM